MILVAYFLITIKYLIFLWHIFLYNRNISFEEIFVCLFGLRLNVPFNNFSVMSGRGQHFLG